MKPSDLIIACAGGLLLSGAYFAALWYTARRLPSVRNPLLMLGLSFLLRMLGLLGGFFYLAQGSWERLAACVAGFFIVRTLCLAHMKNSLVRATSAQES